MGAAHAADSDGIGCRRVPRGRQHLRQAWVVSGPLRQTVPGTGCPCTTPGAACVPSLAFAVLGVGTDPRHSASFARWMPSTCCSGTRTPRSRLGARGGDLASVPVCVLGAAFKLGSNDV